jgi:hypothetical protein
MARPYRFPDNPLARRAATGDATFCGVGKVPTSASVDGLAGFLSELDEGDWDRFSVRMVNSFAGLGHFVGVVEVLSGFAFLSVAASSSSVFPAFLPPLLRRALDIFDGADVTVRTILSPCAAVCWFFGTAFFPGVLKCFFFVTWS